VNKKSNIVRIYLPPDANCLLWVMDHCFASKNYVNLVIAGKQPSLQWLDPAAAATHCRIGISVWEWAGNDEGDPDIILACAGDIPTLETVAAAWLLRQHMPEMKVRVVNVVDLLALSPRDVHPHGLDASQFRDRFTDTAHVIFAFHGYVRIIHDLIHGRPEPERFHVRGFMEEGTTTTPFDMTVVNNISRYHLAMEAIRRSRKSTQGKELIAYFENKLREHHHYIREFLDDMPEIKDWTWK
jgi:xylulose-5-phosphate/fructose-6-phosphate phosphoketolase